jgi:hypothetical protein
MVILVAIHRHVNDFPLPHKRGRETPVRVRSVPAAVHVVQWLASHASRIEPFLSGRDGGSV